MPPVEFRITRHTCTRLRLRGGVAVPLQHPPHTIDLSCDHSARRRRFLHAEPPPVRHHRPGENGAPYKIGFVKGQ